jgi:hypothetical protein
MNLKCMNQKTGLIIILLLSILSGCSSDENEDQNDTALIAHYQTLPEKGIAVDEQSGMKAIYVSPSTVYDHAILGDAIEGGALLVIRDHLPYLYTLDSTHVFEDLQPRLADLEGDGIPEIITILSGIHEGASIAVFQLKDDQLSMLATNSFIGSPHRWLNIAAINDLDNDGAVEIAWVTTPHIGGHLHIGRLENNKLVSLADQAGVSNHQLGSRNLCLSSITVENGLKTLYLPNIEFNSILGFRWKNNELNPTDTIAFVVNPLIPLSKQYHFTKLQADQICINFE